MEKNRIEDGVLYLVATPIGNLSDISERALKVLQEVDFIAAEDTRNTAKLLGCYDIKKELVSYYEHNKRESGERIVARLLTGESCALVTDAGMPAISDPGEDIVRLCADRGVIVRIIPGACAAVSALALSGLSTRRFAFEGFLSAKASERRERLEEIKHEARTLIFYEAPHKLVATLTDMVEILGGERKIALCRELTKLNEDVMRTTLSSALDYYRKNSPRGEYVLIVEEGDGKVASGNPIELLSTMPPEMHVAYHESQGLDRMSAIKAAARERGMSKSDFYKLLVN